MMLALAVKQTFRVAMNGTDTINVTAPAAGGVGSVYNALIVATRIL